MDLTTWKVAAHKNLTRLAAQLDSLAPGMIYGALTAAALLPLVTAASQPDARNALVGLIGGVGGNLLANLVQAWKDHSEPELRAELSARAKADDQLRAALDTLLHELAAIQTVQTNLRADDKAWFEAMLRRGLAQAGSHLTVAGDLIQIGNITHSTGIAIGKNITQIIHLYRQPDEALDEAHLGQQIAEYLKWVMARYGKIELRGVRRAGSQVVQLDLEQIYVPLEATTYRERRAIKLNEVLALGPRLTVIGGPGSGKSTVLQHVAWTLATALVRDDPALATTQLGLALAANATLPLPIFLPLSAYALQRRKFEAAHDPRDRTLAGFISYYLIEQQSEFNLPKDFFVRLLNSGRGVMILLDGLDEVPDEAERVNVRAAIEKLVTGRDQMQVIVTCRTAAYKERTTLGGDFREIQVKPLNAEHITALVRQAYTAVYPDDELSRTAKTEELLTGIDNLEAERRRRSGKNTPRLIDSPLLVRMLLVVHLSERRMPQHRAELYMRTTENMLWPEYGLDEEAGERIGRLVGDRPETHREVVQHLAFAMHQRGEQQGRDLDEDDVRRVLNQRPEFAPLIEDFLRLTRLRGTLLEEQMRLYRFIHLAFQEYLAARYLAEVKRDIGIIAQFFEAGPILESWWRETALLVVGYLSMTALSTAQNFVRRLAGIDANASARLALPPDLQLATVEIATTACLEWLEDDQALRTALTKRIVTLFDDQRLMNEAKPVLRAAAGVALGQLGDPRPGVGVKAGLPDLDWVPIAAGPFVMGGDGQFDGKPQFTCTLIRQPYRLSRYPITVAQYRCFVEAKGYQTEKWWTKAGWRWRKQKNITGPREFGSVFETPNHPQTGVSWYEAVAFCAWCTQRMGLRVRLPSEAEWERAARHTDGRIYPWLGEFEPMRCNMVDNGIGSTAAVGSFPGGNAACGAADMSGNVWEWCSTQWLGDYVGYTDKVDDDLAGEARRTLRGGAFVGFGNFVRCACRNLYTPDYGSDGVGFRVVSSGR